MQRNLTTTAAVQAQQYRDLRSMIIQLADLWHRIEDHGATAAYVQRAESLQIGIRLVVAELYLGYDETTRERMIAFAVAVAE